MRVRIRATIELKPGLAISAYDRLAFVDRLLSEIRLTLAVHKKELELPYITATIEEGDGNES